MIAFEFERGSTEGMAEEARVLLFAEAKYRITVALLALVNSFKRTVGGTGKGRLYPRTKDGKSHQASAPGDPPARDFGDYVNSWDWDRNIEVSRDSVEGRVGSRLWEKRGKHLEFGTSRMRPRPHVDAAIEGARADIDKALAGEGIGPGIPTHRKGSR